MVSLIYKIRLVNHLNNLIVKKEMSCDFNLVNNNNAKMFASLFV